MKVEIINSAYLEIDGAKYPVEYKQSEEYTEHGVVPYKMVAVVNGKEYSIECEPAQPDSAGVILCASLFVEIDPLNF